MVEQIEPRLLLATFTVNSTGLENDRNTADGVCDTDLIMPGDQCSFFAAVQQANATAGTDTIAFNIPGTGPFLIQGTRVGTLAVITDPVIIDGATQPGSTPGSPVIELRGVADTRDAFSVGLDISAGDTTVRGLVINTFAYGIRITDRGGNRIEGNFIGTDVTGTIGIGGNGHNDIGVVVENAPDNVIGGTTPAARNVIAGYDLAQVRLFGSGTTDNLVQGNYIGTDKTGTSIDPDAATIGDELNKGVGVAVVVDASFNTIGGTSSGAGNLISGRVGFASVSKASVVIDGNLGDNPVEGTLVVGNRMGVDATGMQPLGFGEVDIRHAPGSIIGGTSPGARNLMSGVSITGATATGNLVQGNYIGTDATGTTALSNGLGVSIQAPNNTIGGTSQGAGNIITGNGAFSSFSEAATVYINGPDATGNRIEGNRIGVEFGAHGTYHGVVITGSASDNTIGGDAAGTGNTIAYNGGDGVFVESGTGNHILGNAIFTNTELGIDLAPDGVTLNDPGDVDTGANNLQNAPELALSVDGRELRVTLDSTAGTAFTFQFFANTACDPSGRGEGQRYLGSTLRSTDSAGRVTFIAPFAGARGELITATATDPAGNTSEFSACAETPIPPPMPIILSGHKFHDLNGDGVQDAGEPGLGDWEIGLDLDSDGSINGVARSDASGNYQFSGVAARDNVNLTQRAGRQEEGAIAINPIDPLNIVAFSNSSPPGLFMAVTRDGGETWTRSTIADGSDGLGQAWSDPSAAFDRFGNLFLTFIQLKPTPDVRVAWSTDKGQTFSLLAILPGDDQPTIATGPGATPGTAAVWVTYADHEGTISVAGGRVNGPGSFGAFLPPVPVPDSLGGNFGDIAVGPDGQVVVTYQSPSGGEGPSGIYVHLDPDGLGAAQAFGPSVLARYSDVGGFDGIPAQSYRQIDAEAGLAYDRSPSPFNGRVYLVYTDERLNESDDTDVLLQYSDDDGRSWSSPVRVNDDATANSQFLPRVAVDQTTGVVAVSWHDARNDLGGRYRGDRPNDETQLFAAVSFDGGRSFLPNLRVSTGTSFAGISPSSMEYGDYAGLAFQGGIFYPIWADNSNSTGDNPDNRRRQFDVYTARVTVIPRGTHTIAELLRPGFRQTFPGDPAGYTIRPTPGDTVRNLDFGNFGLATIAGQVFYDRNNSQAKDSDERGLSGWTILLNPVDTDGDGTFDSGDRSTTTDADGRYEFISVGPGTYSVGQRVQANWVQTTPARTHTANVLAVTSAERYDGNDFGNLANLAVVSGRTFDDLNGNASMDVGEPGLAGWTIFLDANGDGVLNHPDRDNQCDSRAAEPCAVSDEQGNYVLLGLEGVAYRVREVSQSGWIRTTPQPPGFLVESSAQAFGPYDIGNFALGSISGRVFDDFDVEGTGGPPKAGLAGWTVFLDSNGNGRSDAGEPSAVTDAAGAYTLDGLAPGSYTVRELVQDGFVRTFPVGTDSYAVLIASSGEAFLRRDFGNTSNELGKIKGRVYEDRDGDGAFSAGEAVLSGWVVFLDSNGNGLLDAGERSKRSKATGRYGFGGTAPGSYRVVALPQLGFAGVTQDVALAAGARVTADLAAFRPARIRGKLFHDDNRNGMQDPGEAGLGGWTVFLDADEDGVLDPLERNTVSKPTGKYALNNLAPGSYRVTQVVAAGYTQISPPGPGGQRVDLVSGGTRRVQFGNDLADAVAARVGLRMGMPSSGAAGAAEPARDRVQGTGCAAGAQLPRRRLDAWFGRATGHKSTAARIDGILSGGVGAFADGMGTSRVPRHTVLSAALDALLASGPAGFSSLDDWVQAPTTLR